MTDVDPTFDIPRRPERTFARGGVEYDGTTVFRLTPARERSTGALALLVEDVLDGDRYTYGDWFDFPAPVYLVRDREVSTAFRVVVRSGWVEFHVLPDTAAAGLRALYDRLADDDWTVECTTDGA